MKNAMRMEGAQGVSPTAFDRCECLRSIFFHPRSTSLPMQRAARLTLLWEQEYGAGVML